MKKKLSTGIIIVLLVSMIVGPLISMGISGGGSGHTHDHFELTNGIITVNSQLETEMAYDNEIFIIFVPINDPLDNYFLISVNDEPNAELSSEVNGYYKGLSQLQQSEEMYYNEEHDLKIMFLIGEL